jgi:hypothetical protein
VSSRVAVVLTRVTFSDPLPQPPGVVAHPYVMTERMGTW